MPQEDRNSAAGAGSSGLQVLYFNQNLGRPGLETGVTASELVTQFSDAGIRVHVLGGSAATEKPRRRSLVHRPKEFLKARLPVPLCLRLIRFHALVSSLRRTVLAPLRALSYRRHRPDVVLARVYEGDWSPWVMAKILDCALVLEVHTVHDIEANLRFTPRRHQKHRISRWLERRLWQSAERIWINSEELCAVLAGRGVDEARLEMIPNGVATHRFQEPARHQLRSKIRVVFVGSFYPWHGVEGLLRAFARLIPAVPEVRLLVIGDGLLRDTYELEAKRLGIDTHVTFQGWVPYDEVIALLEDSDIAVAPYQRLEPFYFSPLKVLESMAAGLPVVATEQGQIPRMIDHGVEGLLVPPDDENALVQALSTLCADPDLRARMGKAAHSRVAGGFDLAANIRRVADLCAEAVREHRQRRRQSQGS